MRALVCLDGSGIAESILPALRALARRASAELVLLQVVEVPTTVPAGGGVALDEIVVVEERGARRYLRRVADGLAAEGLHVRTVVAIGEIHVEIERAAAHEHADLVALVTHGRSGVGRWLYGSVADAVLHGATPPVLLLRASDRPPGPALDFRRVVVALDGSTTAEEALVPARELARRLAVPLVLMRVVDPMPAAFSNAPYAYGPILAELAGETRSYLETHAARERTAGLAVETLTLSGPPAEVLAAHGSAYPDDLLVLATHGRTGWRAAVMGSVARRVLLLAGGPLLLVRAAAPA